MQIGVPLVGDDLVQVIGDGADIAVDGPFIVVEHDDQALGLLGDIIERLETNAIGERRVAGKGDHILFGAGQIARDCHAESSGKRGAGVACAIAVMLAFGTQGEAIQAAGLAHGVETSTPAGEQFVNVGLVAYIEHKPVRGSVEDVVHSQRQLYDAEVRAEVAARL